MIFIYEIQDAIPINCEAAYKICYPLKDAKNQYRFLYKLGIDLLKKIDQIHFIYKKGFELKFYSKVLAQYSSERASYSDNELLEKVYELTLLPSPREIEDKRKQNLIHSLIRNQRFVEIENWEGFVKEQEIVVNLPFKGELTTNVLQKISDKKRVVLFTNSEQMKTKGTSILEQVDSELYFEIDKKLKTIASQRGNVPSEVDYYFQPKPLLEIFNNTLLRQLSIVQEDDKKRLQIFGEDSLLATKAIDHLLSSFKYDDHDLMYGIPKISSSDKPLVLFNFDALNDINDYKELYDRTKSINWLTFIILQSVNKKIVPFFKQYYEIELPNRKNIEKVITSIFISFLLEMDPLKPDFYKLQPLIQHNAFLNLLHELKDLKNLQEIFRKLQKIDVDDLLHNTDMWCFIIKELKQMNNSKPIEQKHKQKVIIEYSEKEWILYGLGNPIQFEYSKSLGIKYIAIILYYYKLYGKPIDVSKLRDIAHDLDDDTPSKYQDNQDSDNDRKAVYNNIKRIQTKQAVEDFCKNHIKYADLEYWFDSKNEVECEVNHPKITKDFFSKYTK